MNVFPRRHAQLPFKSRMARLAIELMRDPVRPLGESFFKGFYRFFPREYAAASADAQLLIEESRLAPGEYLPMIGIICERIQWRPEKSEVERLWADNGKALELLGWYPRYGGLDGFRRGLAESVAWFTEPAHLASYKSGIYNL